MTFHEAVNMECHADANVLQTLASVTLIGGDMAYHSHVAPPAAWQKQLGEMLSSVRKRRKDLTTAGIARRVREWLGEPVEDGREPNTQVLYDVEKGKGVNSNYIAGYLVALNLTLELRWNESNIVELVPALMTDELRTDIDVQDTLIQGVKVVADQDLLTAIIMVWNRVDSKTRLRMQAACSRLWLEFLEGAPKQNPNTGTDPNP